MSETEIDAHRYPYSRELAKELGRTLSRNLGFIAGRHAYLLYFKRDMHIGGALEFYGEWAEVEHQLFRQIVKPGMIVIEAGSNIGTLTVPLARLAGPTGCIHAFEPQRRLFQILCANLALNDIGNVHAYQAGLGDENTTMYLPPVDYTEFANFAGLELQQSGEEAVDVRTIDSCGLEKVDFIKVDVEKMETKVLAGGRRTIEMSRPIIFAENDGHTIPNELIGALFGMNYRCWWHLSSPFNPHNFFACKEDIWKGKAASNNMVCIPREKCVGEIMGIVENLIEAKDVSEIWLGALRKTQRLFATPE